eukprot:5504793-Prymnesium_polylepis.2
MAVIGRALGNTRSGEESADSELLGARKAAAARLRELCQPDKRRPDQVIDFSGADLSGMDISHLNLAGERVAHSERRVFPPYVCPHTLRSGVVFKGAKLVRTNMYGAVLRGADLRDADLSFADMRRCSGEGVSMVRANIHGVRLCRARLDEARMAGVWGIPGLSHVKLPEAEEEPMPYDPAWTAESVALHDSAAGEDALDEKNISKKDRIRGVVDLQMTSLRGATLQGSNLGSSSMKSADLTNANVKGAILAFVNFQEAILSGANVDEANLAGADLSGADLSGAVNTSSDPKLIQAIYVEGPRDADVVL